MSRFEISACEQAMLGVTSANSYFGIGMYPTRRNVPVDYVTARKWFNIAAMTGNAEAIRLCRAIAVAQRAARDWMKTSGTTDQVRSAA